MHQRQYRPGDVLDDYCPRERRITDHAIVAMVDDEIQRTRCVVCEAEHEFKNARVPAPRRRSGNATLFTQVLDAIDAPAVKMHPPESEPAPGAVEPVADEPADAAAAAPPAPPESSGDVAEDRPFRRSLIRAQLPRLDNQPPPTRAIPEFTMHQPLNQRGKRPAQGRFRRRPGQGAEQGGPMRFGRDGNAAGHGHGHGQGQPGQGPGQGQGGRRRRRKKH